MQESPLIIKSKEFALQIIRVCNEIKNTKKESVLTNQLVSTSNLRAHNPILNANCKSIVILFMHVKKFFAL